MGYKESMEAAGATVHDFKEFGSYQGDWWARVTLPDGREGWINGSYGSCSGCDAFEAEFSWSDETCAEHSYEHGPHVDACEDCQKAKKTRTEQLARFGAGYLDALMSQEEAEAAAAKNLEWDSDAQAMLDFIKANTLDSATTSRDA